jgi:iron complex transport system substrate-binding protein
MNMFRKVTALFLSFILAAGLFGCTAKGGNTAKDSNSANSSSTVNTESTQQKKVSYPLTIKDSYDRVVTIDREPQRIISLAPNITETIFALGMSEKLVGRTDFCDYPAEVKNIASVGYIDEPSIEKITELKPDLVIGSSILKKESSQKIEELGIKLILIKDEISFDGVYQVIEKVGEALNASDKAKEVTDGMKQKVKDVADKVNGKGKPVVYYVVGFGQGGDFTSGKGTFQGQIIEMAGGTNAAGDVEGWQYSLEKLVEKNPDILICSKYFDSKKGIESANGYKDLKAVKEGKLFEIDNNMIDRQGPRLADGLVEIARIIHPEAFK